MRRLESLAVMVAAYGVTATWGWGAAVHRAVTREALSSLPPDRPAWLGSAETAAAIAFQSNQPDRWRGWPALALKHENDPDHFLDAELLDQFGLTLETVPRLRREYVRVMVAAKALHPEHVEPHDLAKDPARAQEWPGFLLHAIAEHYAKLQAAFNQVRILERADDPGRAADLEQARQVAIYHLGALSHFVADASQPLHTTKHYNGWVGDNPAAYKWRERFHAYVDEGWAQTHKVDDGALRAARKAPVAVRAGDPWEDVLAYFSRSFGQVTPLYALERDGLLDGPEGRRLIVERLSDASTMLASLVWAAYESSAPTDEQVQRWFFYDGQGAAPTTQPATRPTRVNPGAGQ